MSQFLLAKPLKWQREIERYFDRCTAWQRHLSYSFFLKNKRNNRSFQALSKCISGYSKIKFIVLRRVYKRHLSHFSYLKHFIKTRNVDIL